MNLTYTFDLLLALLLILLIGLRCVMYFKNKKDSSSASGNEEKMRSIHYKFLAVFWTFRFADWMQGPYFYEVYASKTYVVFERENLTFITQLFMDYHSKFSRFERALEYEY